MKNSSHTDLNKYLLQLRLHGQSPKKWILWGKRHIGKGGNPFAIFYTPGIGSIIKAGLHTLDNENIPECLKPLDIKMCGLLPLLLQDKTAFREKVKSLIVKKARQIASLHQGADNKILSHREISLANWGVVVTNKRRVLGFGEVPDGGEWITRGKCDCYEMATSGSLYKMLPIAVSVNCEKLHDPHLHDACIMEILNVLDSLEISLIQFEDFDGESAFRLLAWSKKNLKVPFFNDDIEGTAWILWMAKLAAKARSLLLHNVSNFRHLKSILFDESDSARKKGVIFFRDSLFVFHGGGAAAIGAANFFKAMLLPIYRKSGMTRHQAEIHIKQQCIITDSAGLLYKGRRVKRAKITPGVERSNIKEYKDFQVRFGWINGDPKVLSAIHKKMKQEKYSGRVNLTDALEIFADNTYLNRLGRNGTIFLMGLTGHPGGITENMIRKARHLTDQKGGLDIFIDSASNPTYLTDILTKDESTHFVSSSPKERLQILQKAVERVYQAADRRMILTTGSPFYVKSYTIAQLNNLFGFPAAGWSVLMGGVKTIDDAMGEKIALTILEYLVDKENDWLLAGGLCPSSEGIFDIVTSLELL